MFSAKIIEDSISEAGVRLTTMQLCYPRFIHAEAKTHRIIRNSGEEYIVLTQDEGFMDDPNLSRNASSSRAIPVAKMIKQVRENPAMPIHWGKNQKGMQAKEEHNELVRIYFPDGSFALMPPDEAWEHTAYVVSQFAEAFMDAGYHKQVVNRLLETFQWMHVIVTATEWENFFELRDHEDADPNIQRLAKLMRQAMDFSVPKVLKAGQWHLPYVTVEERWLLPNDTLKKLSTARCARVSFLNHDGSTPDIAKDCQLYSDLVGARPLHASPCEHQGTPLAESDKWSGNFRGWHQHRKEIEDQLWR